MPAASPALQHPARRLALLVAAVWAAALTGAVVGLAALLDDGRPAVPSSGPAATATGGAFALGDRIPTSFGSASVGTVLRLVGRRDALGLRIAAGDRAFQLHLTLTNLERRPVVVGPATLGMTPAAGVRDLQVATGSAAGGRIDALSTHRYAIRFVVPATGALPALRLRDPGSGRISTVALGTAQGLPTLDIGAHHGFAPDPQTGGRRR